MTTTILQALIALSMESSRKNVIVEVREVTSETISHEITAQSVALNMFRDSGEEFETFCKALAEV
jgi:hypothetical protein